MITDSQVIFQNCMESTFPAHQQLLLNLCLMGSVSNVRKD